MRTFSCLKTPAPSPKNPNGRMRARSSAVLAGWDCSHCGLATTTWSHQLAIPVSPRGPSGAKCDFC
eukprot:6240178-Alexandrium_andersonii.AAC.1